MRMIDRFSAAQGALAIMLAYAPCESGCFALCTDI